MAEGILNVDEGNFETEVLGSDEPVLVDFWAEWCGPCRMIAPIFEELAQEYQGRVKFAKLNVDQAPGVAGQFGVMSIPTLIIFKDGEPANRIIGLQPKQALQHQLEEAIS